MKTCSSLFLWMIIGLTLLAEAPNVRFEKIIPEQEGVRITRFYTMLQDNAGYLWIGTDSGLARYDGYGFKFWRHLAGDPVSLCNDRVLALLLDKEGRLWVGTDKGLACFDPVKRTFTNYKHSPEVENSLSNNHIRSLVLDSRGQVWIGTKGGGLCRYNRAQDNFTTYKSLLDTPGALPSSLVWVMRSSRHYGHTIWGGTPRGFFRFDWKTGEFKTYVEAADKSWNLKDILVRSLYEDKDGVLWIGTGGAGLARFDPVNETFTWFRKENAGDGVFTPIDNYIFSIVQDSQGIIWLATRKGLNWWNLQTNESGLFSHNPQDIDSISHDRVISLFQDRSGLLWAGTFIGGLNKIIPLKFRTHKPDAYSPGAIPGNSVTAFLEDSSGRLWLGTRGGVYVLDNVSGCILKQFVYNPTDPSSLSDNDVKALFRDQKGNIWVGTHRRGLNRYHRGSGSFVRYEAQPGSKHGISYNRVMAFAQGQDDRVWMGTDHGGLNCFDLGTGRFSHFRHEVGNQNSLWNDRILSLYCDREGILWMGVKYWGIEKFDPRQGKWEHFFSQLGEPDEPWSKLRVYSILQTKNRILWFASSKGLIKHNKKLGSWTLYSTREGFPHQEMMGLLEDQEGYIWVSSLGGLSQFNPNSGEICNYRKAQGLQSDFFNANACLKSRGGELFFGGINGYNRFFPANIKKSPFLPRLVITSVINEDDPGTTHLFMDNPRDYTIPPGGHRITLEFAALNYLAPQEHRFSYKLEGRDSHWNSLGKRHSLLLRDLSPGGYKLKVKVCNHEGTWSDRELSMPIRVKSRFLDSPGIAFSILPLLVISLLLWQVVARKRSLIREESDIDFVHVFKKFRISQRESAIILLVMKGMSNREIEDQLFISLKTVKNHLYNIYRKFSVKSRLQLIYKVNKYYKG